MEKHKLSVRAQKKYKSFILIADFDRFRMHSQYTRIKRDQTEKGVPNN